MPTADLNGETISVREDRFARFQAVQWWKQETLANAKVLVVGAGALGNEVIKNLALLGIGRLAIVDMDRIEESNLSRSSLFRPEHEGEFKAERAAKSANSLYPNIKTRTYVGNVMADVGFGVFRWADIVVGALDNREARVFVNRACAYVDTPWIDGGIEVLNGIVRGFHPPHTPCYECSMSKTDWDLIDRRQSCSLHARRALANHGAPTTPTTASVIGAIQAQEVVKHLHGLDTLMGKGFLFEGLNHSSYPITYTRNPNCELHEPFPAIFCEPALNSQSSLRSIMDWGAAKLGGADAIDLNREIVTATLCPSCGVRQDVFANVETVPASATFCSNCNAEKSAEYLHSLARSSGLLDLTPGQIGLPANDVVWVRRGVEAIGLQMNDAPIL